VRVHLTVRTLWRRFGAPTLRGAGQALSQPLRFAQQSVDLGQQRLSLLTREGA
jgi:hypothetical protein